MGRRFEGQVALITGGTKGIGLAIAKRLGSEGATVVISSRKQASIDEALRSLKQANITDVYATTCHAGKEIDIKNLIDFTVNKCNLKKINILVANAATNPFVGDILESEASHWNKIYQVNLLGQYLLCKYAVPYMVKGNSSIIINSSVGAWNFSTGPGAIPIYHLFKLALVGFTKILSKSCTPKGIRVCGVAPGLIRTKMSKMLCESVDSGKISASKISDSGRLGEPEDISGVVAFLASKDASYISGETIIINGGTSSRL
eukprot:137881_1